MASSGAEDVIDSSIVSDWSNSTLTVSNGTTMNWGGTISVGDWGQAQIAIPKVKRKTFWGEKYQNGDPIAFFKLLKKGLSKKESLDFKRLAERAMQEAIEYADIGQKTVAKDLEKAMAKNLKLAAIETAKYDISITTDQIKEYKKELPNNKQLVIDDLEEYEKPVPVSVRKNIKKAKDWKIFDSFAVFHIVEVKDPIVFGQIDEDPDTYFFIDEWDNDISIEDLLKY